MLNETVFVIKEPPIILKKSIGSVFLLKVLNSRVTLTMGSKNNLGSRVGVRRYSDGTFTILFTIYAYSSFNIRFLNTEHKEQV